MNSFQLQDAFGYLFIEEIHELQKLSKDCKKILQIGAGAGTSTLAILESSDDSIITTIDVRKDNNPFGSLFAESEVVKKVGLSHRLRQHHGDSKEIIPFVQWCDYDMVFIDGDHSYEGCKSDIRNCIEFVLADGGIISVHDYKKEDAYHNVHGKAPHPKVLVGVNDAVDEFLLGKYELISHVRSLISFRI